MSKIFSKKNMIWIGGAIIVLIGLLFGLQYWKAKQTALPKGITSGNGRLEAKLVDISAKEPLRVLEVLAAEGDVVSPGQIVAHLDTVTLKAELAESNESVAAAEEKVAFSRANIVKQKSEIELAEIELKRSGRLVKEGAGSQREYDTRKARLETTRASLAEAEAMLKTSRQQVNVAKANAATIQTRIDDATLKSPVFGRVLYRLAEPGEVLGAGGKVITLVNLEDVYMEVFLPAEDASRINIGSEGRILLDYATTTPIPGFVSFVSPEAQFTPKQVETRSEREKLMFRVKIQVPKELANQYVERVKTGTRGVGYIKIDASANWPDWLKLAAPQPGA